jgi:hypothetical protein
MKRPEIGKVKVLIKLANFNDRPIVDEEEEKKKEKIIYLKAESMNLDHEYQNLEKEYLAKIAKLMIMVHTHCELKDETISTIADLQM